MNHRSSRKVQNQGQVSLGVADADLIDRDVLEILQRRRFELPVKVPLVEVFDDVPTDAQVMRNVLNGHRATQFQGIAFEGLRVAVATDGKGHADLPNHTAPATADSLHGQLNQDRTAAYGEGPQPANLLALAYRFGAAAMGAAEFLRFLIDHKDGVRPLQERANMTIALNAKAMVQ
jgi:hypothetical protein